MYLAAKERQDATGAENMLLVQRLTNELNQLQTKESRLLDAYIGGSIEHAAYEAKCNELKRSRVDLENSLKRADAQNPSVTLEPIKDIFLQASRAKKEYLAGNEEQKERILKTLLWNAHMQNDRMARYSLRSPFSLMVKVGKSNEILELLPDLDSNQDGRYQKP
jgi:hypothetical protein